MKFIIILKKLIIDLISNFYLYLFLILHVIHPMILNLLDSLYHLGKLYKDLYLYIMVDVVMVLSIYQYLILYNHYSNHLIFYHLLV